jgi:hypothetical protein
MVGIAQTRYCCHISADARLQPLIATGSTGAARPGWFQTHTSQKCWDGETNDGRGFKLRGSDGAEQPLPLRRMDLRRVQLGHAGVVPLEAVS